MMANSAAGTGNHYARDLFDLIVTEAVLRLDLKLDFHNDDHVQSGPLLANRRRAHFYARWIRLTITRTGNRDDNKHACHRQRRRWAGAASP